MFLTEYKRSLNTRDKAAILPVIQSIDPKSCPTYKIAHSFKNCKTSQYGSLIEQRIPCFLLSLYQTPNTILIFGVHILCKYYN